MKGVGTLEKLFKVILFTMIASIMLPTIVFGAGADWVVQDINPSEIPLSTISPDSTNGVSVEWAEIDGYTTMRFKIEGSGGSAETYKIPMLQASNVHVFFLAHTDPNYYNDGEGRWESITDAADPLDDSSIPDEDRVLYKTLQKGVEYRIIIYNESVESVKNNPLYNKLTIEHYSDSDDQTTSPIGGTPIAPGVDPSDGSELYPYIIDGDTDINYESVPFIFIVKDGGKEGTYIVKADYENKKVSFKYVDGKKYVGYYKEHSGDPDYEQVGVTAVTLQNEPLNPTYKITAYKYNLLSIKEYDLANGYTGASISGDIPYPSAYVFVQVTTSPEAKYHFYGANVEMNENAGFIERVLTYFLLAVGTVLQLIFQLVIGKSVTITSIIFNGFNDTMIGFFGQSSGTVSTQLSTAINYWFDVFRYLALVFYLIMLIYVAIKLFIASTADDKGKYKESMNNWVLGLVILFFFPYVLKYIIVLNNALVSALGKDRMQIYTYLNLADIHKIEMDGNYAGGDAYTVEIEKLKEEEAGLQAKYEELSNKLTELKNGILRYMGSFYYDIYDKCKPWEQANKVISQFNYLRDVFIPENAKNWTDAVEEDYQRRIDQIIADMYAGGYRTYNNASLNKLLEIIKEESIKVGEVQSELEIVRMKIAVQESSTDVMGKMLLKAAQTGRLVYALVWLVLFWQIIFLLILYYKRVFMIAFLIIIFPLVMITYVKDKLDDGKSQVFNTWFKEYLVNVIIQFFHAVAYIVLVEAGLKIYQSNQDKWLFYIIALTSLFPLEKILRSIFGLNASTLSSLEKTFSRGFAVAASGAVIVSSFRGSKAERERSKAERKQKKEAKKNKNISEQSRANSAIQGYNDDTSSGARIRPGSGVNSGIKDIVKDSYARGKNVMNKTKNITSKIGRHMGAISGLAAGLAGGGDPDDLAKGAKIGSSVGESMLNTLGSVGSYSANKIIAAAENRAIKSGALDNELGISSGYTEDNKQRIRNAIARGNRKARTAGEAVGEASAWGGEKNIGSININEKNTMPKLDETIEIIEENE